MLAQATKISRQTSIYGKGLQLRDFPNDILYLAQNIHNLQYTPGMDNVIYTHDNFVHRCCFAAVTIPNLRPNPNGDSCGDVQKNGPKAGPCRTQRVSSNVWVILFT